MARKILVETGYTFTPSTNTIVIPRTIPRERLILITNVTTNQVIYNFSDSNLKANSYTTNSVTDTTTVVLNFSTTAMSSTDKLQIIIDDYDERIYPSETLMDPVTKMRVATPQALMDTDFEYSTQSTKWETLTLQGNRPTSFYDSTLPVTSVTNISGTGTRTVTVTLTNTTGIAVGTPVFIQDSTNAIANGWQLVETVSANANFTYVARANVTNGTMFDPSKTYVFIGNFYTGAAIPVTSFTNAGVTVTCNTTSAHGLSVGNGIFVRNTTATTNPPNGAFFIKTVPSSNTFTFDVDLAPTGTITATGGGTQNLYGRPYSTSIHRAADGGVAFSTGNPYHSNQIIRQTRRYFRYQSGKGVQFSTGTNLKARIIVNSITRAALVVTVTCKFPHNLGPGGTVVVSGVDQAEYNGTFTVTDTPTDTTFTYNLAGGAPATPATGYPITVSPGTWYGSRVRIGMFDEQNGVFFEYDGQTLYAVRRSSTEELSGGISVTNGSQAVTGVGTKFSSELKPFDYIVIRGMTYLVLNIANDTTMTITPEYRGTTISTNSVFITKRLQDKIPQSQWNIDKCDGTGLSGYNMDLAKMQMFYIDYSWYGAGAIRFGFKNQRGEVVYAHRIANANYRTEAYMRSGNLPARYECNTIAPVTYLTATLNSATGVGGTISVNSTAEFPPSGIVVIRAASANSNGTGAAIEYVSYSAKTATTLTISARGVTNLTGPGGLTGGGGAAATTFTYSATAPISVELHSPQTSVNVSHWGSSVIMDGRFDDDKSFVFTAGMNTSLSIASGVTNALMSIRLAPSVDSGLTGTLGQRELINRMQLTLREIGAVASANMRVSLILNGRPSAGTFTPAGGSSLAQICFHAATTTVTGGETIYSFFVPNGVNSKELDLVRDLGNCILGGGNNLNVPTTVNNLYPDGPDMVTIVATNVAPNAQTINARLSWTEAQA